MRQRNEVIYSNLLRLMEKSGKRYKDCDLRKRDYKLRTKQFFELCINIIPDIDKELMALAISQYNDIVSFGTEIATIAHLQDSFPRDSLQEKRNHIIEMLRRSSEQEEFALSYIQKAAANIQKWIFYYWLFRWGIVYNILSTAKGRIM